MPRELLRVSIDIDPDNKGGYIVYVDPASRMDLTYRCKTQTEAFRYLSALFESWEQASFNLRSGRSKHGD